MNVVSLKKRLSLAAKFNLLTIGLILITAVGICLFVVRLEMSSSYGELLNHGKAIADTTARNCEFGIFTENESALAAILEGLGVDADIAYVSVLTRDHRTLAARSFKGSGIMQEDLGAGLTAISEARLREFVDKRDGHRYTEILYPVVSAEAGEMADVLLAGRAKQPSTVIGYLRLGLTQEGLKKRINELIVSIFLFTSLLVLFGTGLSLFLSRRITSPLERLTAATQYIAEGKFDSPIDIRTNDEIADLAASLDHMRGSLLAYHVQAEERTKELTDTNVKMREEIDARKAVEDKLQYDALHDVLTDLPNRALFMDRLTHTIVMAKRRKDYIYAVLFLDIDRFKVVNDSLGHVIGDQLLIAIGQRLLTCVRPGDTVARLGGDEYAVLLEDIRGLGNATFIADRISAALDTALVVGGNEVFVTGSIGIALSAADYDFPEQVLRDADTAMYQAKSSSHATYAVFEPGMHIHALERMHLETDLRKAIERKEFVVFYQPIISLTTNRLAGYEALIRWQHPERGLINPGDFMPMADETGAIVSIDRLVLREACRQMHEWHGRFPLDPPAFISVNLSNKQMVQPDLVDHVARILKETGMDPGSLKLEITENVIIEKPEETVTMLTRLKALGLRLYIDDFGTGYSSLSYLHRLPIDGLKIDRSFIWRMGENGENQEIIRTILLLARDMNIGVIAEGVETANQLAQIKALSCEYGQGYLFSRPVESSRAQALLENPGTIYSV